MLFFIFSTTALGKILLSSNSKQDLDNEGPRILNLIHEIGEIYLEFFPRIFIHMVSKANKLIGSAYFNEVIQVNYYYQWWIISLMKT